MPNLVEISPEVLKKKIFFKISFNILPLLEKGQGPLFVKTLFLFTQGCFVPSLVEISPVVLGKKLYFVNVFSLFRNYLPLEKGGALPLN